MTKCARTVCTFEGTLPHRDLPGLYCVACARLINEVNGVELIGIAPSGDVRVAGTEAQTEDMFVGYIELTATERSYLQGAIAEHYMNDTFQPPLPTNPSNRRDFANRVAMKVLGPLRLVKKPE